MYLRWLAGHGMRIVAAPLVGAAAFTGLGQGAASAATCVNWTGVQPPSPGSSFNVLTGVAVASSCRAWTVGYYSNGTAFQTLIEDWNGSSWAQQSSPDPGGSTRDNSLDAAAATSASNAWAVGSYFNGTDVRTLAVHWNGTIWVQVPSPNPSSLGNALRGVAATSSSNAWAVGQYFNGSTARDQTLTERWNGTTWKRVASPNPGGSSRDNVLAAVAATSASNAWAVGYYSNGTANQSLIEHWNGTAWTQVPSPNPGGSTHDNLLLSVAATSASSAWAVGDYYNGITYQSLIMRWDGTAWKRVASPNPGSQANVLRGVVAISPSDAWVVGSYYSTAHQTLTAHWNGTAWTQVPSPDLGGSTRENVLFGVDATSAANIWAVGEYHNGTAYQNLALHCC